MTVAFAIALNGLQRLAVQRPVFNRSVLRNGIRARVRFIGIGGDPDRHSFLVGRHQDESHVQVVRQALLAARRRR